MMRAFGRNKLAAEFRARKFLLFGQQYPCALRRQVNRGAGAGGTAAGDDHVVIERSIHPLKPVSEPGAVATGSDTQLVVMIRSLPLSVLKPHSKSDAKE